MSYGWVDHPKWIQDKTAEQKHDGKEAKKDFGRQRTLPDVVGTFGVPKRINIHIFLSTCEQK